MKKSIFMFVLSAFTLALAVGVSACNNSKNSCKDIQLMGAGDRIHDSYTFANSGVELKDDGNNTFTISGSVRYLSNQAVKEEFNIAEDVDHVVAIKLSNCGTTTTVADEVEISVNGVRNYDAEHLNGTNYTFIILEAAPGSTTTISVKWSADSDAKEYTIKMAENLQLRTIDQD